MDPAGRLAELEAARSVVAARGDTVPYLGTALRLVPQPGRTRAHRRGDELLVPAGDERGPALERWYRRTARGEIAPRLDRACEQAGLSYTRLTIRAQRTRWASCTRSGAMSFNWRLLLAPPEVLDYVVWHEVCHLQVLDHSPRFWALLERLVPGLSGAVGLAAAPRPDARPLNVGCAQAASRWAAGSTSSSSVVSPWYVRTDWTGGQTA